jgi:hypothetical protein
MCPRSVVFILIFCVNCMSAQVLNIEDPTVSIDSLKKNDVKWGMGLNGNISKQSLFVYDASLLAEATYHRNDRHQVLLNAQYFRTGSNLGDLINGGFVFVRITPEFHHRIAPQWVVQYQSDLGRGMKERVLTALNVRAEVFKSEKFAFQFVTGAMLERETWNISGAIDASQGIRVRESLKSNNVFRFYKQLGNHAELSLVSYIQFPFSNPTSTIRIANQLSFSFQVSKRFQFQLNLSSMYDTNPVIDIPNFYYTSATGMGFKRE